MGSHLARAVQFLSFFDLDLTETRCGSVRKSIGVKQAPCCMLEVLYITSTQLRLHTLIFTTVERVQRSAQRRHSTHDGRNLCGSSPSSSHIKQGSCAAWHQ